MTNETDKPAARPWQIRDRGGPGWPQREIVGSDGQRVLCIDPVNPFHAHNGSHSQRQAHAELIVRAVNSHDALVEACKAAKEVLDKAELSSTTAWRQCFTALALAKKKRP